MLKALYTKKWLFVLISLICIFVLFTLVNYLFCRENNGGTDFLASWTGTRNFFDTGESPYSAATSEAIQKMNEGQKTQIGNQELRVTYPLYTLFIFAPFSIVKNFVLARALWMSLLEICLIGIVVMSIRLTSWKIGPWLLCVLILCTLGSYNGLQALIDGDTIILVTLFVVLFLFFVRYGKDEEAGILLALTTIKPQVVVLFLVFILIWAIAVKRTKILAWFLGSMILFIGFSLLLIPNWIAQYLRAVIIVSGNAQVGSVGDSLVTAWGAIGQRFSIGITVLMTVLLLLEWWEARYSGIKRFFWVVFLTLAISQWIGLPTDPGNFIILFPGILFCFYMISDRWKKRSELFLIVFSLLLTIGVWGVFFAVGGSLSQVNQELALYFPIPLTALGLLYWLRWWMIESGKIELNTKTLDI